MTLASVADIRAATTLTETWAFVLPTLSFTSSFKFSNETQIGPAATAVGETPTAFGGFAALPSSGIMTREASDLRGARTWHYFFDLIWYGQDIPTTATGTTAINSVAFPARDVDGSSNGRGYLLAVTGISTTDVTISYTNSDGVAGRTSGNPPVITNQTSVCIVPLQAGDSGVRSVQSLTVGTAGATSIRVVVLRPIGRFNAIPLPVGDRRSATLERLLSGTVMLNAHQGLGNASGGSCYVRTDIALG